MSNFNLFIPPYNPGTINMAFGLSGTGVQPLNNLNDLWLKATQNLQKGDLMVCSGDFVQACIACCLGAVTTTKSGTKSYTADQPTLQKFATQFSTNGNTVTACDISCELNTETTPKYTQVGAPFPCQEGDTNPNCQQCTMAIKADSTQIPGMCLSGCVNNYANQCEGTFTYCKTDADCKTGVKCTKAVDNYPATENDLDLFEELKAALARGAFVCFVIDANFFVNIFPDTKIQSDFVFYQLREASPTNFFWFNLPPHGEQMYVHAKICTAFYWSSDRTLKYLYSSIGSFNPSFPMSLTLEIASCITGFLVSPVIEQIALFTFAFLNNANNNHDGYFNHADWSSMWNVLSQMFYNNFPHWKIKFPSINTNGITTNINFCGKLFSYSPKGSAYDPLKDSKYVTFTEKNVKFFLGAEGAVLNADSRFGTNWNAYSNILPWGLDLMKKVINETQTDLKIGYYGNFLDCDANTGNCGQYPWLITTEMKKVLNDPAKKTYIIQKPTRIPTACPDKTQKDQNKCKIEAMQENADWPLTTYRGNNQNFFYKWYMKSAFHWKYLMTDNSIFMSSQHPILFFYGTGDTNDRSSTHGYDMVLQNCPYIIEYFNNIYDYIWNNRSYYTTAELQRLNLTDETFPKLGQNNFFISGPTSAKDFTGQNIIFTYRDIACGSDFPAGCPVSTGVNCKKANGEICSNECGDVGTCLSNPDCCFDFDSAKKGKGGGVPWCFQKAKVTPVTTKSPVKPTAYSNPSSRGWSRTSKDILNFVIILIIIGLLIFILVKTNVIGFNYS